MGRGDRRPRLEVGDPRFINDLRSIHMEVKEHLMLKRPSPMTSAPKPHNARTYYEFHEQNGHMTKKYWELRKALRKLANKGQINRF